MSKEYEKHNLQPNFKPIDHLFQDRLRQFIDGGKYRDLNLPKFYDFDRVDTNTEYINIKSYKVPDGKNGKTQRPLFKDINWDEVKWQDSNKGDSFGPSWKTFWFKVELSIPSEWLSKKPEAIEFQWDSNNEAMICNDKGLPLQAFTGGNERTLFRIPKRYWKEGVHRFYVEMSCNGMFGNGSDGSPNPNRYFQLSKCDLVLPNLEARRLMWDFWIIGDAAREFPGNSWQKWQANQLCNDIMNTFDPDNVESIGECRKLAKRYLGDKIDSDEVFATDSRIDVFGVGNCHIDTAWEWPFAETKRKIVRSWTTQLRLAEEYPEYIFVASQMQQFKWLKEYHPEILKQIKDKFTTNQFLPIGGSWVENDTNLPNGESLIRQFLLGQRFQYNEFGIYSNIFWLPDTFGYSSQVPQICQQVGINNFLTQKLSWNNINQFPLSTFNWIGIDRSQVLVHMPPANTYTASANFGDIKRSLEQHKNLRDVPTGLLLFGHGDGGGGPTDEMFEKIRRCRGMSDTSGLLPTVHLGNTVEDFYDDILERSNGGKELPSWTGEIYLEFHRGTYTTQAYVKKLMRINEIKLHDLEWLATLVSITNNNYKYPKSEITALWEDLCLCQFHDVLPGSCIGMVYYEEVWPMLEKVLKNANNLINDALSIIKDDGKFTLSSLNYLNTLPWSRSEILRINQKEHSDLFDAISEDFAVKEGNDLIISVANNLGVTKINYKSEIRYPASVVEEEGVFVLSNKKIKATISKSGILTSVIDLEHGREIIDATATKQTDSGESIGGNQFVLYDDEPLNFPAWDTELYSLTKYKLLTKNEVSILTNNELESSVLIKTHISDKSSIETVVSIEGLTDFKAVQNSFIKFKSKVDWHETYKFLKVQFPTTVYTSQQANYETQFGLTSRPTHYNTSWDVAKFEVCHHKFMDLSEFNYGVSILNNSKYGGSIRGNLMTLSLLRSAKAPDDKADMGQHEFEYALYPHYGPLGSDTVKLGYNFNHKLCHGVNSTRLPELLSSIKLTDGGSLVLSHLKRSEDDEDVSLHENIPIKNKGQKSLIIRIYESLGGSSSGKLEFDLDVLPVDKMFKTNALEQESEEIPLHEGSVSIRLRGFEIATYKVVLKA